MEDVLISSGGANLKKRSVEEMPVDELPPSKRPAPILPAVETDDVEQPAVPKSALALHLNDEVIPPSPLGRMNENEDVGNDVLPSMGFLKVICISSYGPSMTEALWSRLRRENLTNGETEETYVVDRMNQAVATILEDLIRGDNIYRDYGYDSNYGAFSVHYVPLGLVPFMSVKQVSSGDGDGYEHVSYSSKLMYQTVLSKIDDGSLPTVAHVRRYLKRFMALSARRRVLTVYGDDLLRGDKSDVEDM